MATAGRQVFALVRPAARRARGQHDLRRLATSASACRTARASTPRSCRWRSPAGLTSAITNPLLPRSGTAVMAADVLHGQRPGLRPLDPRPTASPPPEGEVSGRRVNRRSRRPPVAVPRRVAGRLTEPTAAGDEPLVIFTPSGRRGRFPPGTTVLDAARSLGVDIDSVCGGRGICGRCQVEQGWASSPSTASPRAPDHLSPFGALEAAYRDDARASPPTAASSCTAPGPRRRRDRRPAREPGPPPGRPQGPRRPRRSTLDPVVRLHYVEVEPPELASPTGDLARLFEALEREWELDGPRGRPRGHPGAPAGARGGRVPGHGRGPRRRSTIIGDLAGPPRQGLRRRDRRRLDDDRRPPRRPRRRRGPRLAPA